LQSAFQQNPKQEHERRLQQLNDDPFVREQAGQNKDVTENPSSLPRTAGELPVLQLIGFPSLIAAAGTRLVARTNR
jgi:hypothetical protein